MIGKLGCHIDDGVGRNTGNQTAAFIKSHHESKTNCDCVTHLEEGIHTSLPGQQVHNMSGSEGHSGYDDCLFDTVFLDGSVQ